MANSQDQDQPMQDAPKEDHSLEVDESIKYEIRVVRLITLTSHID
jgi:hypothetical protein